MAQSFPTSAQVIYDTLATDSDFLALIGEYTFKAGQTVPAMSIVTPGQDLPSVKKVSGIEVVIHDAADVKRRDYLTSNADLFIDWKVFFICWEPATGLFLTAAVARAMQRFAGSMSFETVAVADGIGAQVQTMLIIKGDMPILGAVNSATGNLDWDDVLLRATFDSDVNDVKSSIVGQVNGATVVGSPSKFGGGAVRISGSQSLLYSGLDFMTSAFTVEFWLYFDNLAPGGFFGFKRTVFTKGNTYFTYETPGGSTTENVTFGLRNYAAGGVDTDFPMATTMSANQWYHIALTRSQSTGAVQLFVDGQSRGTVNGNDLADDVIYAFAFIDGLANNIDMFIDDLRISSFERYTADFTPPTNALPVS